MDKVIADLEELSAMVAVDVDKQLVVLNASVEKGLQELQEFLVEYF